MEHTDHEKIKEAIHATVHGNPDAYTVIVTAYMQKLYRTALSLCGNAATAEDLVQETLIDGYLHLSDLREAEKLESWLMRILRNKTLNHLTRTRKTESEDALYALSDKRTPESLYMNAETMREWKAKLSTLSPALRETAMLYFWHNLTMEQIAHRTGTPLGTVKRRIHDAREKLKKENNMTNEKMNLPDGFAEALSVKIKELENYTQTYGHTGFDSAYRNVKELIANLSDTEDVRKYTLESASIAAGSDPGKYAPEALEACRKYGDIVRASDLYIDLIWKMNNAQEKSDYVKNTVLPDLGSYPESEAKHQELGHHLFWMAQFALEADKSDTDSVKKYLDLAAAEFAGTKAVNAMYANTISAQKGYELLTDGIGVMKFISVTAETWFDTGDNVFFFNQPGCDYAWSSTSRFMNYITYYAGAAGDGYFLPKNTPYTEGGEEDMNDRRKGTYYGKRKIVSLSETVVTPSGIHENCLHIRKTETDGNSIDIWYKKGVGIVKSASEKGCETKVLSSYEIVGGDGYLPLAAGNRWCYETPDKPDALIERNEYVIEQTGKYYNSRPLEKYSLADCRAVSVSCLNYFALREDWRETTDDTPLLQAHAAQLCEEKKYPEAADVLRKIIMANRTRESVDASLELLRVLEEKLPYDAQNWRFCPSSANISTIEMKNDAIVYGESMYESLDTGVWGSRNPEDRIFGVKPFRYLDMLCGTLWSDKWVPGYTEERAHPWDDDAKIRITVDEGGSVETPAGTFDDTVHVTVDCGDCDNPEYFFYFYSNTHHGRKEYWFARGVGVVRFRCTWGKHLTTDAPLTKYHTVSAGEMMPIHIGNFWQYDEQTLTSENYIARREYKVISGMNGKYLLGDHQFFTWKGSVDEYEAWKKTIVK